MAIGACYAELTALLPEAGSEFIYAHRIYGRGVEGAPGAAPGPPLPLGAPLAAEPEEQATREREETRTRARAMARI